MYSRGYSSYRSYGSSYRSPYSSSYYGNSNRRSIYDRSDYSSNRYRNVYDYPSYSDFYYGNRRRRNYWERDREINRSRRRSRAVERRDTPSPPPTPEPEPKPEPPAEEFNKQLKVKEVDYHIKENTKQHETHDYYDCSKEDDPELVVRRGDNVKITLTLDRPYDKKQNDMKLSFTLGENPATSRGTKAVFEVDETKGKKFEPEEWGATLEDKNGNSATILVHIPCNCIIGEWNFTIKTFSEGKTKEGVEKTLIFNYDSEPITILFNPWCKDDTVYMENSTERNEYVLNDSGCVYRGNAYQPGTKIWTMGQFEKDILDIVLQLTRTGFRGGVTKAMSDPVKVSRLVAKLVNSSDDRGVLVGNWSDNFSGGVSPSTWTGSVEILRQWRKSGPVKYGQCWVFSAVTTTVCRALGIPCRSVTNFSSAHDADGTNCIEKYYDSNGEAIKHLNNDSIWNFHVWNEVWMARPDLKRLKTGFEYLRKAGWQVIDATPQEQSDGVYTCGPCPVEAVYRGYCSVDYDTGFVFAEVNSDVVSWTVTDKGEYEVNYVSKAHTGEKVCTKLADGLPITSPRKQMLDITSIYKPDEGSTEERDAVMLALNTAANKTKGDYMKDYKEKRGNVISHLLHDNETMIGNDLKIQLTVKNNETGAIKMKSARIIVAAKKYDGVTSKPFFVEKFDETVLEANEETVFTAMLDHNDYLANVIEQAHFSIVAMAMYQKVGDSEHFYIRKEHNFRFRRPDIEVSCPKSAKVGDKVKFDVMFKNPLDKALTNCSISTEATGIENIENQSQKDVPANDEFRRTFVLKAERVKKHATVTFSFDCKQLKDISGGNSLEITI